MRLLIILLIAGGFYLKSNMDDPNSTLGRDARRIVAEIQNAARNHTAHFETDYASTAAARPNTMDWAARGGSSVGTAPDPWPTFGRTSDLATARAQLDEAYGRYEYWLSNYGGPNPRTQEARQAYLDAKYHYDALANRAGR